jgi:signal transduction histidine kinase
MSGDLECNYDAARLQQVFSNLLNNAAQYSPSRSLIQLTAHGDPDAVLVQVRNSGSPIPENSLKAIFDPLVQLAADEDQPPRPNTSIGLGLFIAREITAAHGGSINAESSPEGITTFSVRIPKTASAQEMGRVTAGRAA